MGRVTKLTATRRPRPEFADLWAALVEDCKREFAELSKKIPSNIPSDGNYVLKSVLAQMIADLEAKYEEIDKKFAQQLLALVDTGDTVKVI